MLVLAGIKPEIPKELPEKWALAIKYCWRRDPSFRPTAAELFDFLNGNPVSIPNEPDIIPKMAAPKSVSFTAELLSDKLPEENNSHNLRIEANSLNTCTNLQGFFFPIPDLSVYCTSKDAASLLASGNRPVILNNHFIRKEMVQC